MGPMGSMKALRVVTDIAKPLVDKRLYRALVLPNELKVCLISDPQGDKSAASMAVNVGSFSSPEEVDGVAHYLEHMLFMGTEKYPGEKDYTEYLTNHGGCANAFTSYDDTVYTFDVAPEFLKGALDIFSQFFLCPTFTESAADREAMAVHSEFMNALYSDSHRLYRLVSKVCKPGNVFGKFTMGNEDSLVTKPKARGIKVRDVLMDFHKQYYSSNIMSLVIYGKEPLDELQQYAEDMFSGIANKNVTSPRWNDPPFGPDEVKKSVKYVPVKDIRNLMVSWVIPYEKDHWEASPGSYASHLLGHEGPGSLLSALKKANLAVGLYAGPHSYRGISFMEVTVQLTEEGVEKTDDVLRVLYSYINMVRKAGTQERIFKEAQAIDEMLFQFKNQRSPFETVQQLSENMQFYPAEEYLSGPCLWKKYEPSVIEDLINQLVPEKMVVFTSSKKFNGKTSLTDDIFGVEYSVEDVPETFIEELKTAEAEGMHLPRPNAFVAESLSLVERDTMSSSSKSPRIIKENNMCRCWYRQDDVYQVPKTAVGIKLVSPCAGWSPLHMNLTTLFESLLDDALAEYSYDADLAGLRYSCKATLTGLTLVVEGMSDKLHILLSHIMEKITSFVAAADRFAVFKQERRLGLENFPANKPYKQASYFFNHTMREKGWTWSEQLACHDEVTESALAQFLTSLLAGGFIEMLVYGNSTEDSALSLVDTVVQPLVGNCRMQSLPGSLKQTQRRAVKLSEGANYLYVIDDTVHDSSAVIHSYEFGLSTPSVAAQSALLEQMLTESCFDVLRTQETLGYIVAVYTNRVGGVLHFQILVQSEKKPSYVSERVDAYISTIASVLEEMTQEEFDTHRQSLISQFEEKPKKLRGQFDEYWAQIDMETYNYDRKDKIIKVLQDVTKTEVLELAKLCLLPPRDDSSQDRRKRLAIHVVCQNHKVEMEKDALDAPDNGPKLRTVIQDRNLFKQGLPLSPLPQTFLADYQLTQAKL